MKVSLRVYSRAEVEIPDLPSKVMEFTEQNKGIVLLRLELETSDDNEYAELWVEFATDKDTLEEDTFLERLQEVDGFDESLMQNNQPFFQSDYSDGYDACVSYIALMKKTYPYVKFM